MLRCEVPRRTDHFHEDAQVVPDQAWDRIVPRFAACSETEEEYTECRFDPVEKPEHYNHDEDGIECIDYIEQQLGPVGFVAYCEGNAIKYFHRYKYKGKIIEDLQKHQWYVDRMLKAIQKNKQQKGDN